MSQFGSSARDLLYMIFKRKKLILWVSGGFFAFVLFFTLLKTPKYNVSTIVYIPATVYEESLFGGEGQSPLMGPYSPARSNTEIAIVNSRPVCERVVALYNLHTREIEDPTWRDDIKSAIKWPIKQAISLVKSILGLPDVELSEETKFENAVGALQANVTAEPVPYSSVIKISYKDRDPVMAAKILNSVTDEYLNQHLVMNINQAKSSFYNEQITAVQAKLALMEDQFSQFKSKEELISFEEQEKGMLARISSYESALTEIRKEIISQQNKLDKIASYMRRNPSVLIPSKELAENPLIAQLNRDLVNKRLQLAELRQKYTEESRQVVETQKQIEDYEHQIRAQVNEQLELETSTLDKLVAEENALEATIRGLRAALLSLPKKEVTYRTLESNIQQERALLTSLREKYEEALVEEATDSRSRWVKVIEYAHVPQDPSSPNVMLYLFAGFVLSVLGSLTLVVMLEYFDHTIDTPEDSLHHLKLPVLGSVAEI